MRGMRGISLTLALILPGAISAAEAPAPGRVDAFVEVIAGQGCRMSPYQADEIMPGAGFADTAETKAITEYLIEEGRARILDGRLVVFGGHCGGALDYSARERFFAGLADNGCMMTADQAHVILPRLDVDIREVQLQMERMMAMGEVRLSDDEGTVYLEQSLCDKFKGMSAQITTTEPKEPPKPSTEETRAAFLEYMATVDCRMTREQSHDLLPRAGFSGKEIRPIIKELIEGGHATMSGEDDLLVISEEVCGG